MMTTYKTAEQKYLFEAYANEKGIINQKTINELADEFSKEVYVRPEREDDYKTKAAYGEKKFLAHLIRAGVGAIKDGGDWNSVASALEYMFVIWDYDRKGRHLNSYLSFYCPFARLCGRGRKD